MNMNDVLKQCEAAGRAWAEREAESRAEVSGRWVAGADPALPHGTPEDMADEALEALERAASERWDELVEEHAAAERLAHMCDECAEVPEERIEALKREAGEAGDMDQVAICDRALGGDRAALSECARVIREACGRANGW